MQKSIYSLTSYTAGFVIPMAKPSSIEDNS